ncbi:carbohydrate kinase family protein [Lewinella sp. W8]|uniref:carbohydrate kinase family protein n=1 Tax=Lewinella sp. W8 TaxID=2528208 RepID=UPI0010673632|nr:PfkB family carbohydrate kinase [Lewinella sp. W8]MTB53087.1 carbohydrate kinase [Lewinella sp. W8]
MVTPEIICAGELLMDLISTEYAEDFRSADRYQRLAGGSPANLAMNLARLGRKVGLVATVGQDDAGAMLREGVASLGVDVTHLGRSEEPTTLILVTKSREVSNFEAYRLADRMITDDQFPPAYFQQCWVFHTTAFALSREPARSAILRAADLAAAAGARVSIDFNYAGKIWPDRREALEILRRYLAPAGSLAKFSDVDYARLFAEEVKDPFVAAQRIREQGADVVCLTMGEGGSYVVHDDGQFHLPVRPVEVRDTTGAGDAFWSGFLAAHLAGHDWESCAKAGRGMAERKLTVLGPVRGTVNLTELMED